MNVLMPFLFSVNVMACVATCTLVLMYECFDRKDVKLHMMASFCLWVVSFVLAYTLHGFDSLFH